MDYSTDRADGQPPDPTELRHLIQYLCDLMQMLRAWWEHFEEAIRRVDQAAAIKAYDLMAEGTIAARQISRAIGFELPPPSQDWSLTPRPERPITDL